MTNRTNNINEAANAFCTQCDLRKGDTVWLRGMPHTFTGARRGYLSLAARTVAQKSLISPSHAATSVTRLVGGQWIPLGEGA